MHFFLFQRNDNHLPSSLKQIHKYFSRKSSNWNITDFLEECDLEPYRKKIEEYLLSLKTIVKMEKDQRRENAQKLLDKYKQVSLSF